MSEGPAIVERICAASCDSVFSGLYGPEYIEPQRERYISAARSFEENFGSNRDIGFFSAPGRIEICGNHTDHNHGLVMAASVNLDTLAAAAANGGQTVRICSEGYDGLITVDLSSLEPDSGEFGLSEGMVRGVAAGVKGFGGVTGGFDAYVTSDIVPGSGLSSSASFEIAIGVILSHLFNDGRFTPVELGRIGQYAENVFFGKPSGLQDQLACAVGGVILIDLADPGSPEVDSIDFDLGRFGLKLVLTDTRGSHVGLTDEYAAVRTEMEAVARVFGKAVMNEVDPDRLFSRVSDVRKAAGDRALLRAIHFVMENKRVSALASAIREGRIGDILRLITESGHSSFEYNQNAYPKGAVNQEMPVALALSQWLLEGRGAWRLQGGGFAGTIQAYVPEGLVDAYCSLMNSVFGCDASKAMTIRKTGCVAAVTGADRPSSQTYR